MFETYYQFTKSDVLKAFGVDEETWDAFLKWNSTGNLRQLEIRPVPLLDALDEYISKRIFVARTSPSPNTERQYAWVLNRFHRYVAATNATVMTNEVSVPDIEHFLQNVGKGRFGNKLSPSTWNQRLTILRAFFDWCVDVRYVERNPLLNRDLRIKQSGRLQQPAVLTTLQAERLLQLALESRYGYRNAVLLGIFLGTGGRLSEVIQLREHDIDFRNDRIRFLGKGGKQRFVPFGNDLKKLLLCYVEQLPRIRRDLGVSAEHRDYLFYSHEGARKGRRIGSRAVQDMLQRILRKMDLPRTPDVARITVHKLRHTYAVNMLRSGTSIYDLSRYLGHASIETTMIYLAALSDEHVRKEIEGRFPITPEVERRIREARRGGLKVIERIDAQ